MTGPRSHKDAAVVQNGPYKHAERPIPTDQTAHFAYAYGSRRNTLWHRMLHKTAQRTINFYRNSYPI